MKKFKNLQECLSFIIVFHICFMQCKNMLVSTSGFFNQYNLYLNMFAILLILILYGNLIIRWKLLSRINMKVFLCLFFIVAWWFVSYLVDPKLFVETQFPYSYVKRQETTFIAYCLPLFYAASLLKRTDYLLDNFFRAARVTFLFAAIAFGFYIADPSSAVERGYSMSFGNQMLLTSVLLMFKYINEQQKTDLMFFILTTAFIIIGGSRGPLVSILVLLFYSFIRLKKTRKRVIFITFGFVVMVFMFVFSEQILLKLSDILGEWGISSRTLSMFMNEIGTYDSGRSVYHNELLAALNKSPILGLGAFGGEKTVGLAHSLYIDILANFGYIFGTLFIVVIGYKIFEVLKRDINSSRSLVILMMAIIVFPRGFFDEAFWGAWQLWVIMGLLISSIYDMRTICKKIKKGLPNEFS